MTADRSDRSGAHTAGRSGPHTADRSGAHTAKSDSERALALAYRYVNRRERTVAELRAHLAGRGVEPALAAQAIAELRGQGYVDDSRFARLFAADKRELEGWGGDRIARVLRERGLEQELIEAALDDASPADELERALTLLRRRWPTPPGESRERDRALAMLLRKGYDGELAIEALDLHARAA